VALPPAALAWSVCALGASLYVAGFFQRVAPAVLTQELMSEFDIAATGLGNLSAFYLYGYVAMQIPTGLMVDRWGARRVLSAGAAIAALGSFLFAAAPTVLVANLGRLLIGGSVGVAWVGTLKLAAHWLPGDRFALATGLALAAGMTGAAFAGVPLRWAVVEFGWRAVMTFAAAAIAAISAVIWLVVRDDPAESGYRGYFTGALPAGRKPAVWRGLGEVLRYRNTWLIFVAPQGVSASIIAFAGLWGVPYFVSVYGYSQQHAAFLCTALLLSWALGGPLFGAFSDRIGERKPPYVLAILCSLVLWSAFIHAERPLPHSVLLALLVAAGFSAGGMVVGFAFAKESVPARLAGTAGGVANMGSMTGPMLLQPLIGVVLDLCWRGELAASGVRVYDADAYRIAFSLLLAWLALSLAAALATRETRARQMP
jgi:MFS family permease